jgi:hypothetical protein
MSIKVCKYIEWNFYTLVHLTEILKLQNAFLSDIVFLLYNKQDFELNCNLKTELHNFPKPCKWTMSEPVISENQFKPVHNCSNIQVLVILWSLLLKLDAIQNALNLVKHRNLWNVLSFWHLCTLSWMLLLATTDLRSWPSISKALKRDVEMKLYFVGQARHRINRMHQIQMFCELWLYWLNVQC